MSDFEGRVAVVTGGGNGIGAGLARAFAERGARIALADVDGEALERQQAALEPLGAEVLTVRSDVRRREDLRALADAVFERFGAVHLLCNNAGVVTAGEMATAPHEDWEFTMGVNFWGVVHGIQAFVPRMIEGQQGGHVVNTASMAGLVGMQWLGIYSASKFAVVGLSEALQRELRPHGIGVSVLCPMIVQTGIEANSRRLRAGGSGPQPPPPDAPMQGGTLTVEEVARRVVEAIESKTLYVLTHAEQGEILRRRAARLERAFRRL